MKKVSPLMGKKLSNDRKRRISEGLRRRQEKGLHVGAVRKHPWVTGVCRYAPCGTVFVKRPESVRTGEYCSHDCQVKAIQQKRRKLPEASKLQELYWVQGLSLWQIARMYEVRNHSTVKLAMQKAGIPRRPPNGGIRGDDRRQSMASQQTAA